jgi:hypothetical protein
VSLSGLIRNCLIQEKKIIKKVLSIHINMITASAKALHCDNVEQDVVKDYD